MISNASFETHTGSDNSIGDPIPSVWVLESGENGATSAFSPPNGSWIGYCTPASKNGENPSAPGHPEHLMCYQVRGPRPGIQPTIFTNDQFGPDTYTFYGPRDFCVPSEVQLP